MHGPAEAPILSVQGLTKRFGGLTAVDGVTFDIPPRRRNAIIGPNGAGKTTLFNLIAGELQPTAGRVRFSGREIQHLSAHQIASSGISRTLQIKSVFSGLTVADNVRIAVLCHEKISSPFRAASSYAQAGERVDELLELTGLSGLKARTASTLSYGDIALLEIAIALANRPRLLLLDEPVCGMGPEETARSAQLIRDISQETSIVLIEHDMDLVFDLAEHILVMAQGRILAEGAPEDIAKNAEVQEAYLGSEEDEE